MQLWFYFHSECLGGTYSLFFSLFSFLNFFIFFERWKKSVRKSRNATTKVNWNVTLHSCEELLGVRSHSLGVLLLKWIVSLYAILTSQVWCRGVMGTTTHRHTHVRMYTQIPAHKHRYTRTYNHRHAHPQNTRWVAYNCQIFFCI